MGSNFWAQIWVSKLGVIQNFGGKAPKLGPIGLASTLCV